MVYYLVLLLSKQSLVVELTQHGDPPHGPVALGLIAGHSHEHDEVCGVSGCAECAATLARLVDRAHVRGALGNLVTLHRAQPDLVGEKSIH